MMYLLLQFSLSIEKGSRENALAKIFPGFISIFFGGD
jgi:hypothetical protein